MSKTSKVTMLVSMLAVMVIAGCEKAPSPAEPQQPEAVTEAVEGASKEATEKVNEETQVLVVTPGVAKKLGIKGVVCLKCGHIEGTELCCKPGAETCPKCGLHKGSNGCCDPKVVECLRHNQELRAGQSKPDVLQAD